MATFSLSISEAISTGWEYAKRYGLLVAVIYLIVGVVSGGAQNFFGSLAGSDSLNLMSEAIARGDYESIGKYAQEYNSSVFVQLGSIVSIIITIIVSVGLYNLALGLMSGRYASVEFEAFKVPLAVYLKFFVVELLVGILAFISGMCCIIPAFFVVPRIMFSGIYLIDHPDAGIMESIKASWNMTRGNTLSLIGMFFAFFGIIFLGVLCCCIGVYFAEAILLFSAIAAYNQLKGNLI